MNDIHVLERRRMKMKQDSLKVPHQLPFKNIHSDKYAVVRRVQDFSDGPGPLIIMTETEEFLAIDVSPLLESDASLQAVSTLVQEWLPSTADVGSPDTIVCDYLNGVSYEFVTRGELRGVTLTFVT